MKIGLVLSSTPAYSETFFNSKIKGLQKNGFEVVLFVGSSDKYFNLCPVKPQVQFRSFHLILTIFNFIVFCFLKLSTVLKFVSLERKDEVSFTNIVKKIILNQHILQESNLDWLHFGFATQAIGRENLAKAMNAKMAASIRGFDISLYPLKKPKCYSKLWHKLDKLHVISDDLLDKAYQQEFPKQGKFTKVTPAIDVDFYTNTLQLDFKQINFLTVGRIHWKKGHRDTLKALSFLKEEGIKFTYTIVGDGKKEDLERIQYYIHEVGLQKKVFLLGKLSKEEVKQQYLKSNYYIQYSLQEGFCNAVLEAQSMGLLCFVSNAEGLSENILDTTTGWVVPKYSPHLLAKKIIEILQLNEEEKRKISKFAQQRVATSFHIEKQQQEFINFYKN